MKQLNVLIADKTADFGENCAKILKSYGMNVTLCAKDGLEVIKTVKQQKTDVVVADVFMPNCDMISVLKTIKEMEDKTRPIVMAMSGNDNGLIEREVLESGASYYFLKPIDINMMAQRIIRVLSQMNMLKSIPIS